MSVNKAILIGRLGRNPETRYTQDGKPVTSFSIATDESWKNKSGEKVERTEWHRIVTFNKLAEICGEYLAKGSLIYIEGRIQTRSYEKDNVKHYITEIIANEMKMLGKKEAAGKEIEGVPSPEKTENPNIEDDIPF